MSTQGVGDLIAHTSDIYATIPITFEGRCIDVTGLVAPSICSDIVLCTSFTTVYPRSINSKPLMYIHVYTILIDDRAYNYPYVLYSVL